MHVGQRELATKNRINGPIRKIVQMGESFILLVCETEHRSAEV